VATAAQRRQARAEAFVRFNPESFALREMLRQAIADRDTAISAAIGSRKTLSAAIDRAVPEIQTGHQRALETATGSRAMVDQALSGVQGGGADLIRTAVTRERGGTDARLSESLASALKDLSNRRVEAAAGEASAKRQATAKYGDTVGQAQRRFVDLQREQGAFEAGRVGELQKEASDRAFQRELAELNIEATDRRDRRSDRRQRQESAAERRSERADRNLDRAEYIAKYGITPEQAAAGKKPKRNRSREDVERVRKTTVQYRHKISEAMGHVRKMQEGGLKKDRIFGELRTGGSRPIVKEGKKSGTYKWPSYDPVQIRAAIDLADLGYLRQKTVHDLRMSGMSVPREWLPPQRGTRRGLADTVSRGGRQVSRALGRVGR
jgi:hypothetical protein